MNFNEADLKEYSSAYVRLQYQAIFLLNWPSPQKGRYVLVPQMIYGAEIPALFFLSISKVKESTTENQSSA